MLFHRFGTLSHILAATELDFCCNKKAEELSQDALIDKVGLAFQSGKLQQFQKNHVQHNNITMIHLISSMPLKLSKTYNVYKASMVIMIMILAVDQIEWHDDALFKTWIKLVNRDVKLAH